MASNAIQSDSFDFEFQVSTCCTLNSTQNSICKQNNKQTAQFGLFVIIEIENVFLIFNNVFLISFELLDNEAVA
jgi:hypothetical protein